MMLANLAAALAAAMTSAPSPADFHLYRLRNEGIAPAAFRKLAPQLVAKAWQEMCGPNKVTQRACAEPKDYSIFGSVFPHGCGFLIGKVDMYGPVPNDTRPVQYAYFECAMNGDIDLTDWY